MLPVDDESSLALLYHLNSHPWRSPNLSPEAAFAVHYAEIPGAEPPVPLGATAADSAVAELLRRRRSSRRFQAHVMTRAELATLLLGAGAVVGQWAMAPGLAVARRSTPSAGGLYPLEPYVVVERTENVADGLYRYNTGSHSLQLVRSGSLLNDLGGALMDQYYFAGANAVVVFTAIFGRTLTKYGPRGYRYILLEAGHAAQNVCLLAAEQGLGSICIGVWDGRTSRVLKTQ